MREKVKGKTPARPSRAPSLKKRVGERSRDKIKIKGKDAGTPYPLF
jgi:hypothetical protein